MIEEVNVHVCVYVMCDMVFVYYFYNLMAFRRDRGWIIFYAKEVWLHQQVK